MFSSAQLTSSLYPKLSLLHCTQLHRKTEVTLKWNLHSSIQQYLTKNPFPTALLWRVHILRCICHIPFVFTLQRIFRRLQVIILPTPENVKRHTTGQQRPILNCSLHLWLTEMLASGVSRHPARISTGSHFYQSELLGTVENTVFAGRWCSVCPSVLFTALSKVSLTCTRHFTRHCTLHHTTLHTQHNIVLYST